MIDLVLYDTDLDNSDNNYSNNNNDNEIDDDNDENNDGNVDHNNDEKGGFVLGTDRYDYKVYVIFIDDIINRYNGIEGD